MSKKRAGLGFVSSNHRLIEERMVFRIASTDKLKVKNHDAQHSYLKKEEKKEERASCISEELSSGLTPTFNMF